MSPEESHSQPFGFLPALNAVGSFPKSLYLSHRICVFLLVGEEGGDGHSGGAGQRRGCREVTPEGEGMCLYKGALGGAVRQNPGRGGGGDSSPKSPTPHPLFLQQD